MDQQSDVLFCMVTRWTEVVMDYCFPCAFVKHLVTLERYVVWYVTLWYIYDENIFHLLRWQKNEFAENCVLDFELSCCVSPSNSWHFTFWLLLWDISCFSKQNVTVPHQSFHAKKHDLGKSFLIFQLMKPWLYHATDLLFKKLCMSQPKSNFRKILLFFCLISPHHTNIIAWVENCWWLSPLR